MGTTADRRLAELTFRDQLFAQCANFVYNRVCTGGTSYWRCVSTSSLRTASQSPPNPDYVRQPLFDSYADFKNQLTSIVGIADATQRNNALNAFWTTLQNAGQVPYAQGNQYAFLYRGNATTVQFAGDFNGWNVRQSATNFAGTNLWIREGTLAADARTDYKVVVNSNWILDPANPLQMWSGIGTRQQRAPHARLRLPAGNRPQPGHAARLAHRQHHASTAPIIGYSVNYRVYTPPATPPTSSATCRSSTSPTATNTWPTTSAAWSIVLDNLIAAGELATHDRRLHRSAPAQQPGNNRRLSEYNMNPNFANFVAERARARDRRRLPHRRHRRRPHDPRHLDGRPQRRLLRRRQRATSFTTSPRSRPPTTRTPPSIRSTRTTTCSSSTSSKPTAHSAATATAPTTMANIWTARGYDFDRIIANEGHSWGQWRGQLDDILTTLIGPPLVGDYNRDGTVDAADYVVWQKLAGTSSISQPRPQQHGPHRPGRLRRMAQKRRPHPCTRLGCHWRRQCKRDRSRTRHHLTRHRRLHRRGLPPLYSPYQVPTNFPPPLQLRLAAKLQCTSTACAFVKSLAATAGVATFSSAACGLAQADASAKLPLSAPLTHSDWMLKPTLLPGAKPASGTCSTPARRAAGRTSTGASSTPASPPTPASCSAPATKPRPTTSSTRRPTPTSPIRQKFSPLTPERAAEILKQLERDGLRQVRLPRRRHRVRPRDRPEDSRLGHDQRRRPRLGLAERVRQGPPRVPLGPPRRQAVSLAAQLRVPRSARVQARAHQRAAHNYDIDGLFLDWIRTGDIRDNPQTDADRRRRQRLRDSRTSRPSKRSTASIRTTCPTTTTAGSASAPSRKRCSCATSASASTNTASRCPSP